jgi:hypothetical protein
MATVGAYQGCTLLMPTQVVAQAMGICTIASKLASMASPMIAEMGHPWPFLILTLLIVFAVISAQFLKANSTQQKNEK